MKLALSGCTLIAFIAAAAAIPKDSLQDLTARMDQAAGQFESMSAKVLYTTHIEVINDTSQESGTVLMKKVRADEVAGLIRFDKPNQRTVLFKERTAEVYYPNIKTVQIYDLGKHGEQLDQFLMIGFGTSGTELAKSYDMKVLGADRLDGKPMTKLELTPKVEAVKNVVSKIELWIPDAPSQPYPLQEKIYEKTPDDYRLVNYSDLKINAPMPPNALELKLPAGVKKEYPQK